MLEMLMNMPGAWGLVWGFVLLAPIAYILQVTYDTFHIRKDS